MRKAEYDKLRKMDLHELRGRAEAATYEARHTPPEIEIGNTYHNISLAARFGAVVRYDRQRAAPKFAMRDFRFDPAYVLPSTESSTMALLFDYPTKKENRVVLIEWIDETERHAERDIRDKTLILSTPKPGQLLLPTCYGMVEDTLNRRFGLVLVPPAHIRANLPPILPLGQFHSNECRFHSRNCSMGDILPVNKCWNSVLDSALRRSWSTQSI